MQNRVQQVVDKLSNPRVYDKFLKALSNMEAEVSAEQTETHQTPPPAISDSSQEVSPTVSLDYSVNQGQFSTDLVLIGLDIWKQLKKSDNTSILRR